MRRELVFLALAGLAIAGSLCLADEPVTVIRIDYGLVGTEYHVGDFTGRISTPEEERELIARALNHEFDGVIYWVLPNMGQTRVDGIMSPMRACDNKDDCALEMKRICELHDQDKPDAVVLHTDGNGKTYCTATCKQKKKGQGVVNVTISCQ